MKIAPRLFAGLAALALVVAGSTALVPSPAHAQEEDTGATLLAVGIFAAAAVAVVVLVDEEGNNEQPQSP